MLNGRELSAFRIDAAISAKKSGKEEKSGGDTDGIKSLAAAARTGLMAPGPTSPSFCHLVSARRKRQLAGNWMRATHEVCEARCW